MKQLLTASLLACALSGAASAGTAFDLLGNSALYTLLDDQSGPIAVTNGGIVAVFTASDGTMNRTASGFGLNSVSLGSDDTDAFDVGEWIDITFDIGIILTNVSVSSWSTANGDEATLYVDGISNATITASGSHALNISVSTGSTLRISSTAGTFGNGWSLDRIDVQDASSIPSNFPPVLSSIGNKNVLEQGTLEFTVTASDSVDGDPITLSATNLPTGATFSTNGLFSWSNAVPAGAYEVTFYATDKDGSDSETITITVTERPKLLISEIADPFGVGADIYRFVELYNAGTNSIDLAAASWHLSKQVNGGTWYDIPLTGTVASATAWVIANGAADFEAAYGFAPDQESSTVSGNGDDAYFLYFEGDHTEGLLIDIYGEFDTDGTDTDWNYEDSRAVRHNSVLAPNTVWTASEWTITAEATTNDMTPGVHGPLPEFMGLKNAFVFLGGNLSLDVTAVNTVRTDVITLSATALPAGATFSTATGTNTVSSTLNWIRPAAGSYTASFAASGDVGTANASIAITVSSRSGIVGSFAGWRYGTIVKLNNGQFWQNTGGVGSTIDPPLGSPGVSVTNYLGISWRMTVDGVRNYTEVKQLDLIESSTTTPFNGLYYQNIYQLSDGTVWKQVSFENIPWPTTTINTWRWEENGKTTLRFLDGANNSIGTCTVEPSTAPVTSTITSTIDGWFRGLKSKRVFALANGQFWQQLDLDSSIETIYGPGVTITNWLQSGIWRMSVQGVTSPAYVEVQQLTNVTRTAINGWFYGFGLRNIFRLQDGSWWRQTSLDSSASQNFSPDVLIYNENNTDYLELPDLGRRVEAKRLDVFTESIISSTFRGLRYARIYNMANGWDWVQISSESIPSDAPAPLGMVWNENGKTFLLVRDQNDQPIGTCEVIDPWADDDGDGVRNVDEAIAGTSLFDRNDLFMITLGNPDSEGRIVLRWTPVPGRIYTIEWTPSLTQPFQTLETLTDWTENLWIDTINPPGSGGFYRISARLAD